MTDSFSGRAVAQTKTIPADTTAEIGDLARTRGEALALVVDRLETILRQSPPIIREYTAFLSGTQGKLLRAQSVLASAQNPEGLIPQNAVFIATAIELVHLATLVHDDVIDQADTRRGKPTLRKAHGNKTAVICGDYLLSQGVKLISTLEGPEKFLDRKFQDYLANLCMGELSQHLNNNNFNLTPLQYFRIISGKTAALFEASFLAGAVTGNEPVHVWKLYRLLGHYIGMIFQMTDDCLDFESDVATSGKSVQSDYEQNVITLPLIFSFRNNTVFKDMAVKANQRGEKLPRPVINQSVWANRGLERTHQVISRYGAKAGKILQQLPVSDDKRDALGQLLKKALRQS